MAIQDPAGKKEVILKAELGGFVSLGNILGLNTPLWRLFSKSFMHSFNEAFLGLTVWPWVLIQLDSITDSMDMNLSKPQEIGKDRKAWHDAVYGVTKSWTWLSDWTTTVWQFLCWAGGEMDGDTEMNSPFSVDSTQPPDILPPSWRRIITFQPQH